MRYLRLFSVLFLLSFAVTGCHRRHERALPPPQAQAPIVTTMPPVPPLSFPDVQLAKPKPAPVVVKQPPAPQPTKKNVQKVRHHRIRHKTPTETAAMGSSTLGNPDSEKPNAAKTDDTASGGTGTSAIPDGSPASSGAPESGASVLGKLSADDATADPHENVQTERLIQRTEVRLKKVPGDLRAKHKDAVAQVSSFLAQAKQAWAMNDVVGAQTLANKAKILLDELLSNSLPVR